LSATLADPQQYSLVMTDALGVPVLKRDALRYTNELHFAALANGTYFLTVRGPRGKAVYTVVKRE